VNIGRNDPCHCGSGKKYKKCCLAKDEEEAHKKSVSPYREKKPKPPPDPHDLALRERWEEFNAASYEGRIALFTRTLDEPELMDGEMAFQMLNQLFSQAAESNERDRFDALTESLRERLPDVFAEEEKHVIERRIINALEQGRHEIIPSFTSDLARLADLDIDIWNRVEDQLAYHGHLITLVQAMRLAWPEVSKSTRIVPWGIDEFRFRAVQFEVLNYVSQTPSPDVNDPVLHEKIEYFYGKEYFKDRIAHLINILIGQVDRRWTLDDFNLPPPDEESNDDWDDDNYWDERENDEDEWEDEEDDDDREGDSEGEEEFENKDADEERPVEATHPARTNLADLTIQFIRYAHDQEGVSYSKAEMGRSEIQTFIHQRHSGSLEYRESMLDAMLRSEGLKREPLKKFKEYKHLLVPDRERFEHYLSNMFQVWARRSHRAAALMELIPVWLRFLESQGLIEEDLRKRTLRDLEPLTGDLLKIYRRDHGDHALCDAMERWKWYAGKEPV
jgi:hypothetical protein